MQNRLGSAIVTAVLFGFFQSTLADETPSPTPAPEPVFQQDGSAASASDTKLPTPPDTTSQPLVENTALTGLKVYPSF
jgi:hypothetical protein